MSTMKKGVTSVGAAVIFILAAVTFVFIPAMTGGYGEGAFTIGKWGTIVINNADGSEFTNNYRYLIGYAEQQKMMPDANGGQKYFFDKTAEIAFKVSAIETAMYAEAADAGYMPPDFLINKELIKYYFDSNGIYSDLRYQETPENQKAANLEAVKKFFCKTRYIADVFGDENKGGGLKSSSKELEYIKDMSQKERSFKYVAFNSDFFPKEEIIKYGRDHENNFYIHNFSMLIYENEDEAAKILTSLQKGSMTFEEAVSANKEDNLTEEDGKLKKAERSDINFLFPDNSDLEKIILLKPLELAPVVKTVYGTYAIVRCNAEPTKPDFESDSVIEKVFSEIKRTDYKIIEDYLVKHAEEFCIDARKESIEDAAKKFNIDIITSHSFALNYGSVNLFAAISPQKDPAFATANKNEDFLKKAFTLKDKEISSPLLLDGNVVVMLLNEEKESDKYTQDTSYDSYKREVSSWLSYYPLAMLFSINGVNYPIPIGQKLFMDFVMTNQKFQNNFNSFMARNAG